MARPRNPNSKRQLMLKNAERLAKEKAEKERLERELKALQEEKEQIMSKNEDTIISEQPADSANAPIVDTAPAESEEIKTENVSRSAAPERDYAALRAKFEQGNLFDRLRVPTEQKQEVGGGGDTDSAESELAQPQTAEFREPTSEELAEESPTLSAPETQQSADPEKVKIKMPPKWTADQIITGFDTIQQFGLPLLYEAKMFSTEERLRIKNLVAQEEIHRKAKERSYTDEELKALNLLMDFDSWKDSLPFSREDKQSLREPLEALLQNANFELSPGWALVFSVAMIMFARTSPILLKMGMEYMEKVGDKALAKEAENGKAG